MKDNFVLTELNCRKCKRMMSVGEMFIDGLCFKCYSKNEPKEKKMSKIDKAIYNIKQDLLKLPIHWDKYSGEEDLDTIKQHIKSQDEEIDRLKNQEYYLFSKKENTITMPQKQFDEIERELITKSNKLDKVKEIVIGRLFEDTMSKVEFDEILRLFDK